MKEEQLGLAKAICIASAVHVTDLDKGDKAYILHPIRVMMRLRTEDPELMQIAILHDVIEDHPDVISFLDLQKKGFSERVIKALNLLTHKPSDSYDEYIERIATNEDAIRVKLEDLRDNADITRLKGVRKKDLKRMEKYHKAFLYLTEALQKFEV